GGTPNAPRGPVASDPLLSAAVVARCWSWAGEHRRSYPRNRADPLFIELRVPRLPPEAMGRLLGGARTRSSAAQGVFRTKHSRPAPCGTQPGPVTVAPSSSG